MRTAQKPSTAPPQLPPGRTQGYLDPAVGGSRWLWDPRQTPQGIFHGYKPGNTPVDPKAAAADLRLFDDLLADTYGRYRQYRGLGVDVAAIAEQHAKRVESSSSITLDEAITPFVRDLRRALPDHHLFPVTNGGAALAKDPDLVSREFRGDVALLEKARSVPGAVRATAEAVRLLRADGSIGSIGSISVKGREGAAELAGLGYRAVAELVPEDKLLPVEKPVYDFRVDGDVGVVRLTSFMTDDPDVNAAHQRFLADLPKHRGLSKLVLDLRGADGGNMAYLDTWARQMRATSTTLPSPYGADSGANSWRQALATTWNAGVDAAINQPESPWSKEQIEAGRQVQREEFPLKPASAYPPLSEAPQPEEHGSAPTDWTGKMLVLVDRRNGSSSEIGPLVLRDWLGATIIGERTAGFVEGLNVAPHQLPNTGYSLLVPTIRATFKDPRISEGSGIPVDVALEDPAMPVARIAAAMLGEAPPSQEAAVV